MFSKKGQIAETINWIVATIIVIVILIISIFIAQIYSGNKGEVYEGNIADTLAKKSLFSYLLTEDNYAKLQNGEFEGRLAENIFKEFYKGEYPYSVWLGIVREDNWENDFFGIRPSSTRAGAYSYAETPFYVHEKIKLNEDKDFELILMEQ